MSDSKANQARIEPMQWPAPVRRVTVRWNGTSWIVLSEVRVPSMTLPAPDILPDGEDSRGFWIELVDANGRVRHRQVMADPLAGMEQFDEGGEVTRLLHPPHDVMIEVLVPDMPGESELALVSNPSAPPHHGGEHQHPRRRFVVRLGDKLREPPSDGPPPADGGHDHDHGRNR